MARKCEATTLSTLSKKAKTKACTKDAEVIVLKNQRRYAVCKLHKSFGVVVDKI